MFYSYIGNGDVEDM